MDLVRSFRRLFRIPGRIAYEADLYIQLTLLHMANRFGRSPITCTGGPVVSLTTYGKRIQSVYLAIESIARGQMRPSRFVLSIDDASLFANLPVEIRRLQRRGLEVMFCENYGPHTKYYPYLESLQDIKEPLVTADDDVLYPRYWLKRLAEAFQQFPDVVSCHRAHRIIVNGDGINRYERWQAVDSTEASFCHVATGVAGVLYPVQLQREIKREAAAFVNCCPNADDIWLHVIALRAGFRVRQINKKGLRYLYIPGTQSGGLLQRNVVRGENDLQIAATYRASDIDRLQECVVHPSRTLKEPLSAPVPRE